MEPVSRLEISGDFSSSQHPSSRQANPPAFDTASVTAAIPSPYSVTRKNTGSGLNGHTRTLLEDRPVSYHSPSPNSNGQLSNVGSCASTASASHDESSSRESRASSLTMPSVFRDRSDDNGREISDAHIANICWRIKEIFDTPPPERASDPKQQHKIDEQCRRETHKQLYNVQESLCSSMLARLQDPNAKGYMEDLHPQLVRATMTGNHKRHNTKTAILLGAIFKDLAQESRIQNLEDRCVQLCSLLNEVGISPPVTGQTTYPLSANIRRRSSLVAGS